MSIERLVVRHRGIVHLAEERSGFAVLCCSRAALHRYDFTAAPADAKLTCADCRRIQRRQNAT